MASTRGRYMKDYLAAIRRLPPSKQDAVLAGLESPEKDAVILDRARKAISAVGTFETAPSVFDPAADSSDGLRSVAGLDFSDDAIVQAIVLQEILQRRPFPIR